MLLNTAASPGLGRSLGCQNQQRRARAVLAGALPRRDTEPASSNRGLTAAEPFSATQERHAGPGRAAACSLVACSLLLCTQPSAATIEQAQPQSAAAAAVEVLVPQELNERSSGFLTSQRSGEVRQPSYVAPALTTAAASAPAPKAQQLQREYDQYSSTYDELDGGAAADALGFPQLREQLLGKARGHVLEVGVGTGLNLRYYSWGERGVSELTAVDLSRGMLAQAQARVAADPDLRDRQLSFTQADVSSLPFPERSFDSVVDTFSLCVFPDPGAALSEMARVASSAKQGGRVLLLEHSRSDNPLLAAYQDATAAPVAAMSKGCVWNQDVPALLKAAGLKPLSLERHAAGTVVLVEAVVAEQ